MGYDTAIAAVTSSLLQLGSCCRQHVQLGLVCTARMSTLPYIPHACLPRLLLVLLLLLLLLPCAPQVM
jgi:hypothetical protein